MRCESCPNGQFYDINQLRCTYCPSDVPLFDGKKCVACPEGQVYMENKRICAEAPMECIANYVYDPTSDTCVCPRNEPFGDGEKCYSCLLPNYWDREQLKCLSCPEGTEYDSKTNICVGAVANGTAVIIPECEERYVYDEDTEKCVCPQETPYDTGS